MRRLIAACTVLVAWVAAPAAADDVSGDDAGGRIFERGVPVEIQADSLEWDARRELYVARGSVEMRQEERTLNADWVAFSDRTRRGVASGAVVFSDGVDTLRTEFIEFDIDTLQGIMFDAEFDVPSNRAEMRGAEVAKTGDRTYSFKKGEFTTCRCPDPEARKPWKVKADEAKLEVDGYGTTRNATVEILGVPLLWFPWMIYPLKTDRQSGLLFPEFQLSGRNGVELGLPVFWAAADPVNVIFTPRWLQKRGFKADLAMEYVLGERSGGDLLGSFIYDQKVKEDTLETPFAKERWATRGEHDIFLPLGVRFKTRYAFASDNSHPTDFDDLRRYRVNQFLPADAFAMRNWGGAGKLGLLAGAQFSDDLQNPDDTDRDEFLLQRLPEARFRWLPASLPFASWLAPALDVDYAWYQQGDLPQDQYGNPALLETSNGRFLDTGVDGLPTEQGSAGSGIFVEQGRDGLSTAPDPNGDNSPLIGGSNPTGTEGDGFFQEGELLADSGHRATLTPRLGVPLRIGDLLELYPEAGWYETLYQSDAQGFERRGFATARVDLRTRLRGVFGNVTHLLEPRLGYAFVMDTSQSDNPLYVPATAIPQQRLRELDLENITRDPADRVGDFNGLSFGFGNRLYRRPGGDRAGATLLADFVLSGLYDFDGTRFGNIYLDGRAYPFEGMTTRFNLGFDPNDTQVDEGLAEVTWRDQRGDWIIFSYRYLRDIPQFFQAFPAQNDRFENFRAGVDSINQISFGGRLAVTQNWGLTYRVAYTFDRSLLLANEGGIEYISKCRCWALRLEVRDSRNRGAQISVQYRILGFGDDSRTPFDSAATQQLFGLLTNP